MIAAGPWLLLLHQLPSRPSYLRVKIWRRLREAGAVLVKNAVHVLPATDACAEAFGEIRREIEEGRGQCVLARAQLVAGMSDDAMRALFNQARNADYAALEKEHRQLVQKPGSKAARGDAIRAKLERIDQRLAIIRGVDFFGAPGRQAVEALLSRLEHAPIVRSKAGSRQSPAAAGRTWVTRRSIHVDRIACAWLIRRFIDPEARFKFVTGKRYRPSAEELRFDMADAEFTHEGDKCSFEVLLEKLGPRDAALRAIAEIIHDLDIKDARFRRPETERVGAAIDDICCTQPDDMARIARGTALFDALHDAFSASRPHPKLLKRRNRLRIEPDAGLG
jgi:hypothetical protein